MKDKQLAAYKTIVTSLENRLANLQRKYDKLKASTDASLLESERAANSILTEEIEVLKAKMKSSEDATCQWRNLALKFDSHRMQAMGWLKSILAELPSDKFESARAFTLQSPPAAHIPAAWTTPEDHEPISDSLKQARLDLYAKHYTVPLFRTSMQQPVREGFKEPTPQEKELYLVEIQSRHTWNTKFVKPEEVEGFLATKRWRVIGEYFKPCTQNTKG